MTESTLLQQARDHFEASSRQPEARRRQLERVAFDLLLQHLEQQHAAMRGPAQVPGEPRCKVCGCVEWSLAHALSVNESAHEFVLPGVPVAALDLDELQRLCDAATPGPWKFGDGYAWFTVDGPDGREVCETGDATDAAHHDGAFIAAARDALPKLIAEVRRLREAERVNRLWIPAARRNAICFACNLKRNRSVCGDCRSRLREDDCGVLHADD